METCPNCGQPVRDGYPLCPFCGADVEAGEWAGRVGAKEAGEEVKSGAAMGCITSGSIFVFTGAYTAAARSVWIERHWHGAYRPAPPSTLAWGPSAIPLALILGWFLIARRRAPRFARGLGYSIVISAALLLGALAVCR